MASRAVLSAVLRARILLLLTARVLGFAGLSVGILLRIVGLAVVDLGTDVLFSVMILSLGELSSMSLL